MESISELERKIKGIKTPEVKKCAIAYSGGLDSTLGIEMLKRVYKAKEIIPVTIDIGQSEEEIELGKRRAEKLGIKPVIIDKKEEFSGQWLAKAIKANSDYFGYPVSTSMTRQLIAALVAEKAEALGCDAVLEGSTGRGNDQYRMHNVFKMFAPKLKVLVPVRDFDLTRTEELDLCRHWNVPVEEVISGGDDKTMWCRSIASGAISLDQELPDDIWMWVTPPEKAKNEAEKVTIEFANGLPVSLNNEKAPLHQIIDKLNIIAGKNGIGIIDIFEDGIMDLKSREIYEAPAAKVILKAKSDLEAQTLTKQEREFRKIVDAKWAFMVYHGEWFHPLKADLDAFIEKSEEVVNGTVTLKLYKGNITVTEREKTPFSLFFPEIRSIHSRSFNQQWAADAAKIRGLQFEILAKRREKIIKSRG
ncbi:MAG: argininosuccinate synthase [Spirochaetes bacterium]|nr:argininosuccinate synthase [Spirochaetota bacterium]